MPETARRRRCQARISRDVDPWLVLKASAKAKLEKDEQTKVKAKLTNNSNGATPRKNSFPDGLGIGFATNIGEVAPTNDETKDAIARTTFTATEKGTARIKASLDQQTAKARIEVG